MPLPTLLRDFCTGLVLLTLWFSSPALAQDLDRIMTVRDARHLLERAGLGAHPDEVEALLPLTRGEAVEHMVAQLDVSLTTLEPPAALTSDDYVAYWVEGDMEEAEQQTFRVQREKEMGEFRRWWIREMLATSAPAGERLLLIWHNHFVTAFGSLNEEVHALYQQHEMFREKGHGDFRTLLQAVVRDAAMLNYLDNRDSRKGRPNENLARELMELFVLGEGNYTEDDVKEVARTLTGYSYNDLRDFEFQFNEWGHDKGVKTVLGKRGPFDADDVIDIMLDSGLASRFIVSRFWHAYISEFSQDPQAIEALAQKWEASGFDVTELVRLMLRSEAFWAEEYRGTIVKSPVDLLIGTTRSAGRLPEWWPTMSSRLEGLGQHLFDAPNVAGWAGGADWITPARLISRNEVLNELADLYAQPPAPVLAADEGSTMMMADDESATAMGSGQTLRLRYGAENFEGPPMMIVRAFHDREGERPQLLWSSPIIRAEGGIDTERLGRIESLADLNWQVASLDVTEDISSANRFSVAFRNDHCCGPGGSQGGDRNLFIDWLNLDDRVYLAREGTQRSNCSGTDAPGSLYCSGELQLKTFQTLTPDPIAGDDTTVPENQLAVGRVLYSWGQAFRGTQNWNNFTIGLLDVRMNGLHYDALRLEVVETERNNRRELMIKLRSTDCRPDCFYGEWPSTTFDDRDRDMLEVEYMLRPGWDYELKQQYAELDDDHRLLINALWSGVPTFYETMKTGRRWRRNGTEQLGTSWDAVIARIDEVLPKTRYAKGLSNPIPLILPMPAQSGSMMASMMMSQSAGSYLQLLDRDAVEVEWLSRERGAAYQGDALIDLVLAAAPAAPTGASPTFSDLITDPVFQLK